MGIVWGACGCVVLGGRAAAGEPPLARAPAADQAALEIEALVRQLGDDEFAQRERATEALIRLGVTATPALEVGMRDLDREVRYRCRRIINSVQALDRQRRLDAFAAGVQSSDEDQLPGWVRYRQLLGDDRLARELFCEMLKAEWEFLAAIEAGGPRAADALATRCQELQNTQMMQQMFDQTGQTIELGSIAAMVFVASNPEIDVADQTGSYLYAALSSQPSFRSAIQSGTRKPIVRKLLGAWVRRVSGPWSAYHALMLSLQYDLEDGRVPAERIVRGDSAGPLHAQICQNAILVLAKLGDESHIPLLEQRFADATPCSTQRIDNAVTFETQVRDVALAAALHLSKQDVKKFGFDRAQLHPQLVFNPGTLGFNQEKDDAARQRAFAGWRAFRARSPAAAPP